MPMQVGLAELSALANAGRGFIAQVARQDRTLERIWTPAEAAKLVGRDRSSLARVEKDLGMEIARKPGTNYRLGYTFPEIQQFRAHFGTLPWRKPGDPCLIIAGENFKGGTGKSTTCVNLGTYCAEQGLRVLVGDLDSQGTGSAFFGVTPDMQLGQEHTVAHYLMGFADSLHYAIRDTQWPNLKVIPSCLPLGKLEVGGVVTLAGLNNDPMAVREFFMQLRAGFDTVKDDFDVILVDVPPSQGIISTMAALTADALIVPTTAKMPDFASTVQFLTMLAEYLGMVEPDKSWRFVRFLINQFSLKGKTAQDVLTMQEEVKNVMNKVWSGHVFEKVLQESTEIQGNAASFMTPYEQASPNHRVLKHMAEVFDQVLIDIYRCWPSKAEELRARGIV